MATGDIGFFKGKLVDARIELERVTAEYKKFVDARNARPVIPPGPFQGPALLRAGADDAETKRKSEAVGEAMKKQAAAQDLVTAAERTNAMESIKDLPAKIDLETKLLKASELQRPAIQAEIDLLEARKGVLNDEDVAEVRAAANRKTNAEQTKILAQQGIDLLNLQKAGLQVQAEMAANSTRQAPLLKQIVDISEQEEIEALRLNGKWTPAKEAQIKKNDELTKAYIDQTARLKSSTTRTSAPIGWATSGRKSPPACGPRIRKTSIERSSFPILARTGSNCTD
jgi:hypothetical protein